MGPADTDTYDADERGSRMAGSSALAARAAADAAAARSRVRIRLATTLAEVKTARQVVDEVWRPPSGDPAVTESLLWPLVHVGNYCAIAYDDADGVRPIGVCIGFLGRTPAHSLHSHAAGVTTAGAGRNIGFALKQDQRAWALEQDLGIVTWTFDPLIRRNAFFNITRLGARPVEYLVDFYGEMSDAINAGQGSDRLLLEWDLSAVRSVPSARRGMARSHRSGPTEKPCRTTTSDSSRCRRTSSGCGRPTRPWRGSGGTTVREELGGLMSSGWTVVSVSRDGYYELRSNA